MPGPAAMQDSGNAATARNAGLMAQLEAMALEELAAAMHAGGPAPDGDPVAACQDWDLGIPGTTAPATAADSVGTSLSNGAAPTPAASVANDTPAAFAA